MRDQAQETRAPALRNQASRLSYPDAPLGRRMKVKGWLD
jgi:hypothetical protein